MSQFFPVPACIDCNRLTRSITEEEFRKVHDLIKDLGFKHVYVQSIPDNDDFRPDFSKDKPFAGNLPTTNS